MYKDVIGVVGGMGSYATLHFFEELLKAFPSAKEWDRPRILIDNRCTMPSRVLAVLEGENYDQLVMELCDSVRSLINSGATKIILACNTSHCFLNDIYKNVPESRNMIVNIIDSCCKDISRFGEKKVALIASEGTIQSGVFTDKLNEFGIDVVVPKGEQYLTQRNLIEAVKQDMITDQTVNQFIDLIKTFSEDALILGCTEFPVLASKVPEEEFSHIRVYDPLLSAIEVLIKECR